MVKSNSKSGGRKLVLIDGNAILHRAYHALPPLIDKNKEPINAVYGFVSMLLRVIQDLKPSDMVVCFDRKEPTFRHEEYEKYQSHRPEMDKELSSQFEKARKVIDAFGIPVFSKAGFEADDVIGTLAREAEKDVESVIIVTGDKDILQLVNEKTKVYLPVKGLSSAVLMGEIEVIEKLGVKPSQVDDYKALVGDPSDNYPGVPGIGPVTAVKLLNEYEDLDNIYKNIKKLPQTTQDKLMEGKESAIMSRKLAQIITNVEVHIDLKKSSKWQIDSKKVFDTFKTFGFKTLTKRIKKVGEEIKKENQMDLFL